MSSEREILKKLRESESDGLTTYTIKCFDPEGKLLEILNAVKSLGDRGHSCNIVIDPGTEEELSIFYDGDGSDRIREIN